MSSARQPTRDFTVTTFVVNGEQVLLLMHPKLGKLLPPGGHINAGELPDEAAVRETLEETGLIVRLVGEPPLPYESPAQLVRPEGIQLHDISDGHQHIDLIYFAVPTAGVELKSGEGIAQVGWYTVNEMNAAGAADEVIQWSARAIAMVKLRLADI